MFIETASTSAQILIIQKPLSIAVRGVSVYIIDPAHIEGHYDLGFGSHQFSQRPSGTESIVSASNALETSCSDVSC